MERCKLPARIGALVAALALVAACTSSSDDSSVSVGSTEGAPQVKAGFVNGGDAKADPVSGGTLQFSESTPTSTLDPAKLTGSGATGNITLGAVYDVLMRYNPTTGTYEPKLAESLTASPDQRTWTLKLRPNVHFTDGAVLDAAAVVTNLKRYAASRKASGSLLAKLIIQYETPDPLTAVFHLSEPWARFPWLLAGTGGMMVSPNAIAADGKSIKEPIGAGAFKVKLFRSGERIELVRNDGYWGGEIYLDGVTITSVATPSATLDRLEQGQVQMGYVLGAEATARGIDAGLPGYVGLNRGQGYLLNSGGGPTADVRVRRAIAAALNLEQLNQRVSDGKGRYSSQIIAPGSRLHTDTPGPAYDPELARQLVEEVKAETGWDGSIRILDTNQSDPAASLTVQAQLNSVGFKATLDTVPSINDLIRKVIVDKDFDMAWWSLSLWTAAPWALLCDRLQSDSPKNISQYASPEFDRACADLQAATTLEARKQGLAEAQKVMTRDVPFVVVETRPYSLFWSENVHGVVPTEEGSVLLDKAFMTK